MTLRRKRQMRPARSAGIWPDSAILRTVLASSASNSATSLADIHSSVRSLSTMTVATVADLHMARHDHRGLQTEGRSIASYLQTVRNGTTRRKMGGHGTRRRLPSPLSGAVGSHAPPAPPAAAQGGTDVRTSARRSPATDAGTCTCL